MAALLAISSPVMAQTVKTSGSQRGLILREVPVKVAIAQVLRSLIKEPFVICDAALKDDRLVSVNIPPYALKFDNLARIVGQYGYQLRPVSGVIYVCNDNGASLNPASIPAGSPVAASQPIITPNPYYGPPQQYAPVAASQPVLEPVRVDPIKTALEGYRTRYVDPADLKKATAPFFDGLVIDFHTGAGFTPTIFAQGDQKLVDRWVKMVKFLDAPTDSVEVQAMLVEVSHNERSGFAVSAILNAVGNGFGFSVGDGNAQGDKLTFRAPSFDAVASAINTGGNSRIISAPRLTGRSCDKLTLQVGQDVPTLGAVTLSDGGRATQSVEYRRSGVLLDVVACLHKDRIALKVRQELSSFVQTETGVNNSPTLSTRVVDTALDLADDNWTIMGGLVGAETSDTKSSILGIIPTGKTKRKSRTELVLLLNVRRVKTFQSAEGDKSE